MIMSVTHKKRTVTIIISEINDENSTILMGDNYNVKQTVWYLV